MMKITIRLLAAILMTSCMVSCEKEETNHPHQKIHLLVNGDVLDYLSDKAITSIEINNDKVWVLSTKYCDTCYLSPYMSSLPTIEQLTCIHAPVYDYEEPTDARLAGIDNNGNFYTVNFNTIYKTNQIGESELILETDDFIIYSITFDSDGNIWMEGSKGIAFWDGNELKIYEKSSSDVSLKNTHGLAIDNSGVIWVALDFEGLLKIDGDECTIIPNSEISGLDEYSYLRNPIADEEDNIWFSVFNPGANSTILMYDRDKWEYQFPNQKTNGSFVKDSNNKLWFFNSEYENGGFRESSLAYLENGQWINVDVSNIESLIITLNADNDHIYIGTAEGLVVLDR